MVSKQQQLISTLTVFGCGLALATILIEQATFADPCPEVCLAIYDPVCGSDNETYGNECSMKVAACQNNEIITKQYGGECKQSSTPASTVSPDCPAAYSPCDVVRCASPRHCIVDEANGRAKCVCEIDCPQNIWPICGSDNNTYESACTMEIAACNQNKNITEKHAGECKQSKSPDDCSALRCPPSSRCEIDHRSGEAKCSCPKVCTKIFSPVCGSNNQTYSNACVMLVAACETNQTITKLHNGQCTASTPMPRFRIPTRISPGIGVPKFASTSQGPKV